MNRGAVSAFMQIAREIDLPSGEEAFAPCRVPVDDEDVWFPQQGGRGPEQARIARAACWGCEIRELCLERAMTFEGNRGREERFGIWGGLTPPERAQLAKYRRRTFG